MKREVAISIGDDGGKRLSLMRSKEQVGQGIENSKRTEIANVENDESITVVNDVQFEIPLAEVGFLIKPTYKA